MLSLPIDVIETILSILPPYPYHFNLRLVSKAMKEIIENYVNPNQFLYSHIFSPSKEEFEQILAQDPFTMAGVSKYTIYEFTPSFYDECFANRFEC